MHNSKCTTHNFLLPLCIVHFALCIVACSLPSLESPQCTEARDAVKRFYSLHFAGDMRPSTDALNARRVYLTEALAAELESQTETPRDYFTATDNYPKAFRVGECVAETDGRVHLDVMLLWRDDVSSDQKHIDVETVKTGDKWLIAKVE